MTPMTMKTLWAGAFVWAVAPRAAEACSIAPPETTFVHVTPADGERRAPLELPVVVFAHDARGSRLLPNRIRLEVYDADDPAGDPREGIAGRLGPGPRFGSVAWTPDEPLRPDTTYEVEVEVDDFSGLVGTRWSFTTRPAEGGPPERHLEVTLDDLAVEPWERARLGDCGPVLEEDTCEPCQREQIGAEARFRLRYELDITRGDDWLLARTGAGVDEAEALAVLDRGLYADVTDAPIEPDVGAFDRWGAAQVCGAVEVIDAWGVVVLRDVRCLPLPDAPALEWRAPGDDGWLPDCRATPGARLGWWALLLLGIGRRGFAPS